MRLHASLRNRRHSVMRDAFTLLTCGIPNLEPSRLARCKPAMIRSLLRDIFLFGVDRHDRDHRVFEYAGGTQVPLDVAAPGERFRRH
jgi:hypothetical protein